MAKESTLKNMVLTLLTISFISAAVLGSVYSLTQDPIAKAKAAKINAAIAEVVPAFDNSPFDEKYTKTVVENLNGKSVSYILDFYPAKKNGQLIATAVNTYSDKGFGGRVSLMVGLLADGSIHNIAVVSHSETPGLGDKMDISKSNFSVQFKGKNPADFQISVKKDGGDVDAIAAATISSRAYCDAVLRAYNALSK